MVALTVQGNIPSRWVDGGVAAMAAEDKLRRDPARDSVAKCEAESGGPL